MNTFDRRDFLAKGAAAMAFTATLRQSAMAQTSKQAGPAEPTSGPVRLSLKFGMFRSDQSMTEKFKALKKIGFDGVELSSPNNYPRDEVLRARDESGLFIDGLVNSAHWRQPLSDADPKVQAACVESMRQSIDDAKAYGATTVLLVPAVVTEKVSYQEAWDRSQANIRKLIPYAAEKKIAIVIENVWNKFLLSPLEFARYIDEFDSPWVGAQFDVGNVVEFGYPQEWIRVLGKRIYKLDIKEYGRKNRFGYKLGEGDVNWAAVREAIAAIDFHGYCAAEMRGGDAEYLRDLHRRMQKALGTTGSSAAG